MARHVSLRGVEPGLRAMAQRQVNAEEHFISLIQEITGRSREDATKAFATLRKLKALQLDAVGGRYSVKHGAYLDRDVLIRAISWKGK